MNFRPCILAAAAILASAGAAVADDQTVVGFGNAAATATAARSPLVKTAYAHLKERLQASVTNPVILTQTMDALFNTNTCVAHRANLTVSQKQAIVSQLVAEGLVNPNDGASINGGVYAGIFPPLINDADGANACPNLPMPFYAAPGSATGSHHSYPGGLPIHESFNTSSAITFASNYRTVYGNMNKDGLPVVGALGQPSHGSLPISEDIIVGAPMWHDWAKPIVFQFNANGTIFTELNFGGTGTNDNNGAAGDSRTGGHHILSLAESMKRGFPVDFVIAQASAHAAPTLGNEYKVANWIRAAAVIDQIDPIAAGFLVKDTAGHFRLPPLRHLGDIDLLAAGQANILAEYTTHNLSDSDFVFSIPAVNEADVILKAQAPAFGYDPVANPVAYQTQFRNVALSYLSGELIQITYANQGFAGVTTLLNTLRSRKII